MKRICVIFTGGTIGSSRENGIIAPNRANASLLLNLYNRNYGGEAVLEPVVPYIILSENLDAEHLKSLRACISERLSGKYDGIIVTHGTDTLQYTAAYLDYVFASAQIPVVLVSANYPLEDPRSNGTSNFTSAVEFIRSGGCKGVFVAYRNNGEAFAAIHRGAELLPHRPFDDGVFSLFNNVYGRLRGGVFVKNPHYLEQERPDLSEYELSGRVLYLRPYVGMTYPEIPEDTKAVLLEGWHSGTLPTAVPDFRGFCRRAGKMKVPVWLTGSAEGYEYESKQEFGALGIRVLPPLSPIAAYMRLWLKGSL